ncbi:hypothetical protein SAMN05444282_104359 [Bacteroides ovatus]|nr:hypothetical protein Bovatus_01107 [Bacteroides ovatus]SDY95985.1 hypothetical protein SAMN05444282_104359 [Bacteroides ovatus]
MVADGHNLHHSPCAVGRDCGDAKTEQVDSKAATREGIGLMQDTLSFCH